MTDQRLVKRLHRLVDRGNALTAELLAHMAEVDRRRLYLLAACPSMFAYCTEVLKMSEGQTYKRIRAARLARKFPDVLHLVHSGQIHLCALGVLAPHMTEDNGEELLQEAVHKTRRQVEKLVARRSPSPLVPDKVRKLPGRSTKQGACAAAPAAEPLLRCAPAQPPAEPVTAATPTADARESRAAGRKGRSTPLSADTYKIEFTAGELLHGKLRQAQELLRHRVPNGDLASVFERALDALLPKLRQERFAEVANPRKPARKPSKELGTGEEQVCDANRKDSLRDGSDSAIMTTSSSGEGAVKRSRHIPAEVKRQVAERDGHQCTYTDATGRRCPERGLVEFHHVQPFGKDGGHEVANMRLLCRSHNGEEARRDYGDQVMDRWQSQGVGSASSSTVPGDSWQALESAALDSAASQRKTRDTG